jgi:tRNA(fMet)-specific endonuclease VapC
MSVERHVKLFRNGRNQAVRIPREFELPVIVAAELRYGAARKGSARLLAQLLTVLDAFEILPFERPAEITYGDLRARLEATGQPIGGNDMLIAAYAVSLGHAIVTDNEREFSWVDGLPVENWLRF